MTGPDTARCALDPDHLTYHQHVAFSSDVDAAALEDNEAFRISDRGEATVVEWARRDPEEDANPFAYGRVVLAKGVVAVESFCEEWVEQLGRDLAALAVGTLARDETRAIAFGELLASPSSILRPEGDPGGRAGARHDIAVRFLRFAWPFLPEAELGDRTPAAVVATGRGRESIVELLPSLSERLRERWPEFPELDAEELSEILFPAALPAPRHGATPAPKHPRST